MKKTELLQALETVKPGLASKELIEQATSFAFIDGRVVTYNDEISISHPVEGLDIIGAIQAEELYKLLGRLKKEEIEIEASDSEITLKSGGTKAGFTLHNEIKLPLKELDNIEDWKKLPEDFIHFMKFVVGSCSRELSEPILSCVNVNNEGFVESSDNYRMARGEIGEPIPTKSFLIPATSVIELIKIDPTYIAEGGGWMHFRKDEGTQISCRIFEDPFVDIEEHLDVKGMELSLPRTLPEMLNRVSVFAKRDYFLDEAIEISLEKNKVKLECRSEEGWISESANIRYDEEPLSFSITPFLLKGILSETSDCILSDRMLKFAGAGWEYVTVLKEIIT
jgi:DNA polymerase III sliding clamp (beta) subunit (PCNA family)